MGEAASESARRGQIGLSESRTAGGERRYVGISSLQRQGAPSLGVMKRRVIRIHL